jgi:nitric oxide reductase NorE protein
VGLLNTIFLLTSSWFVVRAVDAARRARRSKLKMNLFLAIAMGAGFGVSKFFEYHAKLQHSITIFTNDFFQYYYIFTGFHFFHFIIGIIALIVILSKAYIEEIDKRYVSLIESGASYWHMVDLLWLMLFPLLYLMRA